MWSSCQLLLWSCLPQIGFTAALPVATVGTIKVSVRECGAKGDGVADDSPAFQQAFEQAVTAEHAVVYIPAGTYRLDRPVAVKFAGAVGNGLLVLGDGQGVSVIHCHNTNGALRIRNELCKTQITIRDLTLLATIPDAGTALEVSSSLRGVRNYRTLTVQNVDMRGEDLPTRKYFSRGLYAVAQWRPLFQNVIFGGVLDPALRANDLANDALYHKPEFGLAADWSYAPSFQHCYAWACRTGYRVASRDLSEKERIEDGAFYRCTAVGTSIGIDIDTPGIMPQVVVDTCHLNCRDVGVRLRNRKFFHIVNCLFYGETSEQCAYTDIQLQNCWGGLISGNIFHEATLANLKQEPPSKRVSISIDKHSKDLLLSGNMFNAKGLGIAVEAGASGIKTANNQYINPHVTVQPGYR